MFFSMGLCADVKHLVEPIGAGNELRFHNVDELSAILTTQGKHQPKGGGTGKRNNSAKV